MAAAELLLADIRRQREALDRRERDLREQIAGYRSRVGISSGTRSESIDFESVDEKESSRGDAGGSDSYGAITEAIVVAMHDTKRRMNVPQIAAALEARRIPIRAKSYLAATRTAVRRLAEKGTVRRVATGYYRLA